MKEDAQLKLLKKIEDEHMTQIRDIQNQIAIDSQSKTENEQEFILLNLDD